MANSIGEIVEKQKNEKVTFQFRNGSSISNPKELEKKNKTFAGSCMIHSWSNLAKFKYKFNITEYC